MAKHAIITRLNFPRNSPDYQYYLDLFKENLLHCLQTQTDKNFELWVGTNGELESELLSLPLVNVFRFDLTHKANGAITPFEVKGFEDYDIQTRVDVDDLVSSKFVERINWEFAKSKGTILLNFIPYKLDYDAKELYISKKSPYNDTRTSMFLSMLRPRCFIYKHSHLKMWTEADSVITIPEGYCSLVIHGKNTNSRLHKSKMVKLCKRKI
jgi:hypothetical protein